MKTKVGSEAHLQTSPDGRRREQWRTVNPFARKSVRQCMQDMTLHGVQHIAQEERAVWSRALWTLKTLASFGIFLYLLYWVMSDFYEYNHTTSVEATPADEMEFPAITICNINTFDVTNVSYGESLREITLSTAFGKVKGHEANSSAQEAVYNMSAQTILEDTDPGVSGLFVACFYNNEHFRCSEIFGTSYWGMTRCHTLNVSKLALASSGATSLRVIINVNQAGYVIHEEKSAGVQFFAHDKNVVPNLQSRTSTASPGFSTKIGLTHETLTMLEYPYKSFGGRYCQHTDAIDMSTLPGVDPPYRLINCLKVKAAKLAQDNCTCSLPFSSNSSYPNCTLWDMLVCVQDVLDIVKGNQYNASEELGCPLPCETVTYEPSISFSFFPSTIAEAEFLRRGILTGEDVTSNIVSLDFYYTELILRETIYSAEYSSNTLMGLLGGNMGFFLGASVLSVCELAELGMILLCSLFNRLCCWNNPRHPPIRQVAEINQ